MNIFSTIFKIKSANPPLLVIFFLIGFSSISSADTPTDSLNKDSSKYLSFYETIDGERIHWEVNFMGDDITSIYKNGKRIPDELVADYKEKVYDQLDEMRFGDRKFNFHMPLFVGEDFHFDMEELHKDLEEMEKDLPELKENFQFHYFDSEEFKKEMEGSGAGPRARQLRARRAALPDARLAGRCDQGTADREVEEEAE